MVTETVNNKLGEYLRKIRLSRGLSLKNVEDEIEVSASYINRLENGKRSNPSIVTLERLSNFYGISPTEVMELAGLDVDRHIKQESQNLSFIFESSEYVVVNGIQVPSSLFKLMVDKIFTLDLNKFSDIMDFCKTISEIQSIKNVY